MATSGKNAFLIGPGFIGREVLDLLLAEGYSVTTLVRRESYAKELEQSGAKTVAGTLEDSATIIQQTIASDIVIHTATADHMPSVQAVIEGIERRARDNNKHTIFIHTSGTSLLSDDSKGQFKGDKIYSDDRQDELAALPDTASHRLIDNTILRARQRLSPSAKMVIMTPPLIYGANPKYKRLTIQLPTLTRFALKHGYAGHVGKGVSVWSQIHVVDLARAYVTLLHWLERANADEVLQTPYVFCENGQEAAWGDAVAVIGKALHQAGRIESPDPKEIPEDQYPDLFGQYTAWVVGSNSRSRAVKLRELGWHPKEKGLFESLVEDEIPLILKEPLDDFKGYGGVAASGGS